MKPAIRKPWFREPLITIVEGDSMTHQAHAASCDINNIVSQFHRTGQLPPGRDDPQFIDVTGLQVDLTAAHAAAQETISTATQFGKEHIKKTRAEARKAKKANEESGATPPPKNPPATPEPTKE